MKTTIQLDINPVSIKLFFPEERIKNKYKILEILLEASRYILYNKKEDIARGKYKLIIKKDKMNRLFFVGENKIYSIAFPFNITYSEFEISINYKNSFDLDSSTISSLLSIIKNPSMNSDSCYDFVDPILDLEQQQNINYWTILKELLLLEDGYIRYDRDEDGFKEALEKQQEHRHPLNHIDIFYTNQVTFKLGLEDKYTDTDLIDTLDSNTNCKYLKTAANKSIAASRAGR